MDSHETRRDLNAGDKVTKFKDGFRLHAKEPTEKQEYVNFMLFFVRMCDTEIAAVFA